MRLLERACLLVLAAGGRGAQADPVDLKPFRATYTIEWKGMTAGSADPRAQALRVRMPTTIRSRATSRAACSAWRCPIPSRRPARSASSTGASCRPAFRGSDEKERPVELDLRLGTQARHGRGQGTSRRPGAARRHAGSACRCRSPSLRSLATGKLQDTVRLVDGDKLKDYELQPRRQRRRSRPRSASSTPSSTPASAPAATASRAPGWRRRSAIYR